MSPNSRYHKGVFPTLSRYMIRYSMQRPHSRTRSNPAATTIGSPWPMPSLRKRIVLSQARSLCSFGSEEPIAVSVGEKYCYVGSPRSYFSWASFHRSCDLVSKLCVQDFLLLFGVSTDHFCSSSLQNAKCTRSFLFHMLL